jgi:hypothetical protein
MRFLDASSKQARLWLIHWPGEADGAAVHLQAAPLVQPFI